MAALSKKEQQYRGRETRLPGSPLKESDWEKVVVLKLRGNNNAAISRMTGIGERTLWRLWTYGNPKQPWGQTPIRRIVEEEQAKARALRTQVGDGRNESPLETDERIKVETQIGSATLVEKQAAKKDALESRIAEGHLVKLSRGNVIALAASAVGLVKPASKVAKAIGRVIEGLAEQENYDAELGLRMLREIARYMKDIVETGWRAMEMERLLLGDPSNSGKLASDAASMTDDEAMTMLGNAAKVHAAMTARGWSVVTGGTAKQSEPAKDASADHGQAFDTAASHVTTSAEPDAMDVVATESEATEAVEPPTEDSTPESASEENPNP